MVGFKQTYKGLEDLILWDQFFITCDKLLQTFLKEKGKMNIKEMSLWIVYMYTKDQTVASSPNKVTTITTKYF